jgi:hypothetical protein
MLSAFVLAVSALTADTEPLATINVFSASYAKEFAEAAHLPPLSASQEEVRVWSQSAFIDGMSGWVVTKSEIRFYSRGVNGSHEVDENSLRLEKTIRNERTASRLLRKLTHLSALNGKDYACGFDGSAIAIEGIVEGQQFSLSAINPGFCQESAVKQVARLVSELAQVSRSAP